VTVVKILSIYITNTVLTQTSQFLEVPADYVKSAKVDFLQTR